MTLRALPSIVIENTTRTGGKAENWTEIIDCVQTLGYFGVMVWGTNTYIYMRVYDVGSANWAANLEKPGH